MMEKKQNLLESIQGHYSCLALLRLQRMGILKNLVTSRSAELLAVEADIDFSLLTRVLEFLASSTDFIKQTRKGFYQLDNISYTELLFNLEKFVGAYGPAIGYLGESSKMSSAVNYQALAKAFIEAANFTTLFVPEMIRKSNVSYLLDLGCGTASLLIQLGKQESEFKGLGLDSDLYMCRYARKAIKTADLNQRLKIRCADGGNLTESLTKREIKQVEGVYGRSFLNEFFGKGEVEVIEVLKQLHKLFAGRKAWFIDYFGQLGHGGSSGKKHKLTLLQDLAQLVSGQGIPPPNTQVWRKIYKKAGCKLLKANEFENSDIRWFIHEVVL